MNVNNADGAPPKRRRRSAEEAKRLVLETAAERLENFGLEGLNLTGVADQAGISHGTIIHHFGSSEGMRQALVIHMTRELLSDVLEALRGDTSPAELSNNVFAALGNRGHAQLLAWLAVEHRAPGEQPFLENLPLFRSIIDGVATRICRSDHADDISDESGAHRATDEELRQARLIVLLMGTAALGLGIAGDQLQALLELDDDSRREFPRWLATHLVPEPQ